jgi:hypothetical protein
VWRHVAGAQVILWDFFLVSESTRVDKDNRIGPYRLVSGDIPRHLECSAYEACLGFAAHRRWESFSCAGCFRTQDGTFISQRDPHSPKAGSDRSRLYGK